MGVVQVRVAVPEPIFDVEQLWYDTSRWPVFVDGFDHVDSQDADWPRAGSLTWDSHPGGRGRVVEDVTWFSPREGQDCAIEDPKLIGTQRVRFTPGRVALELEYRLKDGPRTWLLDVLFIRRQLRASMERTLRRFAIEARAERDLAAHVD